MKRLLWTEVQCFRGYRCSRCDWRFPLFEPAEPESLLMEFVKILFRSHSCTHAGPSPSAGKRQRPQAWP